jgi:hypothetical protein
VLLALSSAGLTTVAGAGQKAGEALPVTNLSLAGSAFMVAVLWMLEWREPWPPKPFEAIAALHGADAVDVTWEEKKAPK